MGIKNIFLRLGRTAYFNTLRVFLFKIGGTKIGVGCKISRNVVIKRGVMISQESTIKEGSYLESVNIGKECVIDRGTTLFGRKGIEFRIGDHCYIGLNNILDGSGGLIIGNHVHIASPSVGIWTHTSVYQALVGSKLNQNNLRKEGKVKIGDNVWIGGNTTIYPALKIGKHCVILPNSVVNKDVEDNSMVGGIPAKTVKKIK
jgi:acetyltransferase-like isoleucine patch superfamily enzyme